MDKVFDHIGIAVRRLDDAINMYTDLLGASLLDRYTSDQPGVEVHVAALELGGLHIELMEPTGPSSPMAQFLKLKGKGVHHIAFRVDDLEEAMLLAKEQGIRFLEHTYRTNKRGRRLVYLNPASTEGTLVEYCDYPQV
ncbi:VOC family protein [Pullulanibacillus sp. KACC 23026]|uniref:VOC family protein n=1 Tax=Pullulanibacillus sp. KACC 23026 TaxID=3028315 RepID=UPI0023B12BF9|nr:VOC family protein [Pullulanibacillus sp. KACC 23026]WEG14950.1 VOC family protein [Pullulanibacillus sp. KACC 23026]